jgi:hypothetical protein
MYMTKTEIDLILIILLSIWFGNGLRYRSLYVHEQQSHKYKEASFGEGERRTVH